MARNGNHGAALRITVLTAALLGVYGVAQATPLILEDGLTHIESGRYDYVEVRADISDSTKPTTLNGSGLVINGSGPGVQGAVFAKGSTIYLTGGDITTTGRGLHAYSAGAGDSNTFITGDGLTIETSGSHGAVVYVDFPTGDRSDASIELSNSTITTTGPRGFGLLVGGNNGESTGQGTITATNVDIDTIGAGSIGVKAEFGGTATVVNSKIKTQGASASGLYATSGGSIDATHVIIEGSVGSSESGLVFAGPASSITISNSEITNTVSTPGGARGVNARGDGAKITLNNTNVTLNATGVTNADSGSVIAATFGGEVEVDGGLIASNGDYVRGIAAVRAGGSDATGGELVSASNLTVTTSGYSAHAIQAFGDTAGAPATDTTVHLEKVTIETDGVYALGIQSTRRGAKVTGNDVSISTINTNAAGIEVFEGGSVDLVGGNISTEGDGAFGIRVYTRNGIETAAKLTDFDIVTSGASAIGAVATTDSSIILDGGSVTVGDAYGLYATGTNASITATNAVNVYSEGSSAVFADDNATIELTGGTVTNGRTAGSANGLLASNGASITGTGVTIVAGGESTPGATNGVLANYDGYVNLTDGSVTSNSSLNGRGLSANFNARIDTENVAVSTTGEKSHAVQAWSAIKDDNGGVPSTDRPTISLIGGTIDTVGADSYGLMSQNNGSAISAENLKITTLGADSYGAVAYNGAEIELNNVDTVTSGARAHGISMGETSIAQIPVAEPVPNVDSKITVTGGSIVTTGVDSVGANLQDGGTVVLNDVRVESKGAAIQSKMSQAGQTQNITVGSGSTLAKNNGTLLQVSRGGAGTDGVVNLTMNGGAIAVGNIRDEDSKDGGSTHLVLNNAQWTGGLYGVDSFEIRSGASFTETGGQVSTDTLAMDDGVKVAFTNGVTLTNQFVAKGGTQASFSGVSDLQGGITVDGPSSTFIGNGAKISVPGTKDMQKGVSASNGATVNLTGGSVSAKGTSRTRGVFASTGAKVTTTNVAISTEAAKSHAVHAFVEKNDAAAVPSITVNGGTISTEGNESWGLYALRGGQITSSADVTTKGKAGFGAFVEGNDEANARGGKITLNGGSITTTGQQLDGTEVGSFGVLAKNLGNQVEINGTRITTSGAYADGLRAEDKATIKATNAQITVTGANAHGATLMGGSSLTMTGGGIEASGTGSSGLFIQDQSSAILNGVKVVSAGPSITSSFRAERQQQITVGAASDLTQNNGTLLLVNREIGGEKGTVKLDLQAGSFSAGNVLDQNGTKQVTVNKATDAYWAGIVIDKTTVVVPAGGSQEYTNAPIDGSVASGEGSTVAFNNGADISGSVSSGVDSTTTFNGTTSIGGDVAGQHGSSAAFGGATHIAGSVAGASSSTFTFTGPSTDIGGSVAGAAGSTFSFSGPTTIGGNLAGLGSSFSFSQGTPTTIDGDVDLANGSSIGGGTTGTPIQIGGSAQVGDGSVLGGNLNIAGMVSGSGGTLNPGNSAGVQTYGSLGAFTGTYVAEVNAAGQSDLIKIASGNADLTGIDLKVRQENGNGGYQLNHDYTIVETVKADGISAVADNKFVSEALDESFAGTLVKLDAAKYGANTVKISLSSDTDAIDKLRPGLSANQNATLDGVISVAGVNTSADAALQSTDTKGVLNQLSGELHGSTQASLINASDLTIRTLSNRMRGNLGAGMVAGAPTAQASGSVAGAMPTSAAYPLWAQVVGNWGTLDDDGNAAKAKTQTTGLFIGGDTAFGSGWRVGAALGFTDGEVKVNDRSSKSDVTSYTAAIYGGNSWATAKGNVNLLAGAAYTRHNIDSRRSVSVGGNQTLKADYHANTTQLFTELGYAFPVGQASTVEPYLGVAWISQRAKDFSETGGSAALRGESQNDDVTTMTLGLRGTTMLDVGSNQATLTGGLGWRHAAGDVDTSRRMSFIQGNSAQFTVAGAPIAKNAAVLDLGAEMSVGKSTALGLSYSGQFGDGNTDSTGSLYLKVRFK